MATNSDRHYCWPTAIQTECSWVMADSRKCRIYLGFSVGGLPKRASLIDEERQNVLIFFACICCRYHDSRQSRHCTPTRIDWSKTCTATVMSNTRGGDYSLPTTTTSSTPDKFVAPPLLLARDSHKILSADAEDASTSQRFQYPSLHKDRVRQRRALMIFLICLCCLHWTS